MTKSKYPITVIKPCKRCGKPVKLLMRTWAESRKIPFCDADCKHPKRNRSQEYKNRLEREKRFQLPSSQKAIVANADRDEEYRTALIKHYERRG